MSTDGSIVVSPEQGDGLISSSTGDNTPFRKFGRKTLTAEEAKAKRLRNLFNTVYNYVAVSKLSCSHFTRCGLLFTLFKPLFSLLPQFELLMIFIVDRNLSIKIRTILPVFPLHSRRMGIVLETCSLVCPQKRNIPTTIKLFRNLLISL